jgi:hypothetical protein
LNFLLRFQVAVDEAAQQEAAELAKAARNARMVAARQKAIATIEAMQQKFAAVHGITPKPKNHDSNSSSGHASASTVHSAPSEEVVDRHCVICASDAEPHSLGLIAFVSTSHLRAATDIPAPAVFHEHRCRSDSLSHLNYTVPENLSLNVLASDSRSELQGKYQQRLFSVQSSGISNCCAMSTKQAVVVKFCGHSVHAECFSGFVVSMKQADQQGTGFDGKNSVQLNKGQVLCPFCKFLGNTLVPFVPVNSAPQPTTEISTQSFQDWIPIVASYDFETSWSRIQQPTKKMHCFDFLSRDPMSARVTLQEISELKALDLYRSAEINASTLTLLGVSPLRISHILCDIWFESIRTLRTSSMSSVLTVSGVHQLIVADSIISIELSCRGQRTVDKNSWVLADVRPRDLVCLAQLKAQDRAELAMLAPGVLSDPSWSILKTILHAPLNAVESARSLTTCDLFHFLYKLERSLLFDASIDRHSQLRFALHVLLIFRVAQVCVHSFCVTQRSIVPPFAPSFQSVSPLDNNSSAFTDSQHVWAGTNVPAAEQSSLPGFVASASRVAAASLISSSPLESPDQSEADRITEPWSSYFCSSADSCCALTEHTLQLHLLPLLRQAVLFFRICDLEQGSRPMLASVERPTALSGGSLSVEFSSMLRIIGLPSSVLDLVGGSSDQLPATSAARRVFVRCLSTIFSLNSAPIQSNLSPHALQSRALAAQSQSLIAYRPATLINLPQEYSELYQWITDASCSLSGCIPREPVLCLLCGDLLCGAQPCCRTNGKGEVTHHAQLCGGTAGGVFLLVRHSTILLVADGMSLVAQSPYLDARGEVDPGLRRGRPLYLSATRWAHFQQLFADSAISQEIARKRNHLYAQQCDPLNTW